MKRGAERGTLGETIHPSSRFVSVLFERLPNPVRVILRVHEGGVVLGELAVDSVVQAGNVHGLPKATSEPFRKFLYHNVDALCCVSVWTQYVSFSSFW